MEKNRRLASRGRTSAGRRRRNRARKSRDCSKQRRGLHALYSIRFPGWLGMLRNEAGFGKLVPSRYKKVVIRGGCGMWFFWDFGISIWKKLNSQNPRIFRHNLRSRFWYTNNLEIITDFESLASLEVIGGLITASWLIRLCFSAFLHFLGFFLF